jgi:tRNA threonylcarbamoyladenosine biosynthesis protein TsaB
MLLAINTAHSIYSVAIENKGKVLEDADSAIKENTSKVLMLKINQLIKKTNLKHQDTKTLLVNLGPGTFTGIRIAISTAIGFRLAMNTQLIGITSTQLLAFKLYDGLNPIEIRQDAKRGQIFHQKFDKNLHAIGEITLKDANEFDGIDFPVNFSARDMIGFYHKFQHLTTNNIEPVYVREDYTQK